MARYCQAIHGHQAIHGWPGPSADGLGPSMAPNSPLPVVVLHYFPNQFLSRLSPLFPVGGVIPHLVYQRKPLQGPGIFGRHWTDLEHSDDHGNDLCDTPNLIASGPPLGQRWFGCWPYVASPFFLWFLGGAAAISRFIDGAAAVSRFISRVAVISRFIGGAAVIPTFVCRLAVIPMFVSRHDLPSRGSCRSFRADMRRIASETQSGLANRYISIGSRYPGFIMNGRFLPWQRKSC